jgi:hypothetical protein
MGAAVLANRSARGNRAASAGLAVNFRTVGSLTRLGIGAKWLPPDNQPDLGRGRIMDSEKRAELRRIAAELEKLLAATKAIDEPYLAYLIERARTEAEKPGE